MFHVFSVLLHLFDKSDDQMSDKKPVRRCAIVGGGAAGFFLALNLKEMCPGLDVTIMERSQKVLSKVAVSGGGRCNCTNTFGHVDHLSLVYPRGHRLLGQLFHLFGPHDAYRWFERHGVPLTVQPDDCVFPASQQSQSVIDCFLQGAKRLGVRIETGVKIQSLEELQSFDYIAVTTGGMSKGQSCGWLSESGHQIEAPVPSLFTFRVSDEPLHGFAGTVCQDATLMLTQTRFRASGPLLITHWGLSGPAALKLSSHAARWLSEHDYRAGISVNWLGLDESSAASLIGTMASENRQKHVATLAPNGLTARLWAYLVERSIGAKKDGRWLDMGKKDVNRLVNTLCNDTYRMDGRAAFKEEFVTCGGVSLKSVSSQTLESKSVPGLFFAGEVLDIDGVTGGFNFQAAWTTAYTVATAICKKEQALTDS